MFGFGKKKEQNVPPKKSTLDKLIMGAIVGGAIGSVVGMSIAPQKGKETREYLLQKGKDALEKGKEITDKLQTEIQFEEEAQRPAPKKTLLRRIAGRIFHRQAKPQKKLPPVGTPRSHGVLPINEKDLKKIPVEAVHHQENGAGPYKS